MIIRLLSVGTKPANWLSLGFEAYAKRLNRGVTLELKEIPVQSGKRSALENVRLEGAKLLDAVPDGGHLVSLDRNGAAWDTLELAARMNNWQERASVVCLLIGGPDGLSQACRDQAVESWSLSPLTFPHMLVRVIVAEQVYRAWSYNEGHPYHRQ